MEFEYEGEVPEGLAGAKYMLPPMVACATTVGSEEDYGDYQYRHTIVAPDGRETEFHFGQFSMASTYHRLLTTIPPRACRLEGGYHVQFYIRRIGSNDWSLLGKIKFHISEFQMPLLQVTPPEVQQENP